MQPLELRIRRISQTSVQSTAARFANSSYFSNTCAKCSRWISEFIVFREHVWKVQQPDVEFVVFFEHMRKVQPASKPDRSTFWIAGTLVWGAVCLIHNCNSQNATFCAKCSRLMSELIVFLEHVCKARPLELRIHRIS